MGVKGSRAEDIYLFEGQCLEKIRPEMDSDIHWKANIMQEDMNLTSNEKKNQLHNEHMNRDD